LSVLVVAGCPVNALRSAMPMRTASDPSDDLVTELCQRRGGVLPKEE
jgi:hypothetical protein